MLSSVDDHDCSNHSNVDVTTYIKSIRETKSLTELIEHVNDLKQDSKILEDKMRECTLTNYSRFLQCVKVLDEINECQNKLCPHISFLRDYLNQLYAGKSMFNHDINLEKILKEKRKYEILIKVKQAAKKIDYLVNRLPDSSETLIKIIKRTDNKIRDLSIDTDHLVVEVQDIWQRSKESLNKILCECDEEKSLHLLNLLFKLGHNAESVKTIFVKTFLYNTWDAVIEKCHHQSQSDIFTEESTFIANELNKLKHKYSILFVDNDHFPEGYRQAEIHILQKFVNHIITEHNCSIPQFNDIVAIKQSLTFPKNITALIPMLNKLASIDIECRKVRLESIISDICSSVIFDNASALANDVAQLLIDTSKQVRNKFSKLVSCGDDEFIDDCIRKSQTDILNPDGNCLRSLLSSDKDQLITLKFMLSLLKSIDVTVIQNQISLIVEDVIWQQSEFIIEPLRNMFASRLLLDFDVLNASQFAMSFSSKVNELTRKLHFLGNSGNNDRLTQKSQWSLLNDILRHALLSVIQIIRCNVLSPSNLHQLQVDIGYIKQLLNQFPIEATVNGLLSDEIIECAMVRCIKPMPKTNQEIQSLLHSDR